MAEILGLCCNKYEHTSLSEDILKDISEKDFVSSDKIGPKSFSKFLVRLCELNYKILMKQMHSLIKHIDSEVCIFYFNL
jgi:condensin complex subunit 1